MKAPMPVESLYLERLRLFVHLLQVFDENVITAVLYNYRIAKEESWLHGVISSMRWAQSQGGKHSIPNELLMLNQRQCWYDLRDSAHEIKKVIKKVERAHIFRVRIFGYLLKQQHFHEGVCKDMGWTYDDAPTHDTANVECNACGKVFDSHATLAVHQQKVHGQRMAIRKLVVDGVCRVCGRCFHERGRMLRHLQWGGTRCWIYHFRKFCPLDDDAAAAADRHDRMQGTALHQRSLSHAVVDEGWRWATEEELVPVLPTMVFEGDPFDDPTNEEHFLWSGMGTLPPGKGGRPKTKRDSVDWQVHNVCHDISVWEQKLHAGLVHYSPNYDWVQVPPPLSQGQKYFLVLFSGHRRFGDISSWLQWEGQVIPISIDLAGSGC